MLGLCGAWLAVLFSIKPEPLMNLNWLWSAVMAAWVQAIGTIAVAAWGFISWRREAASRRRATVKAHEDELQRYDALLRAAAEEVRSVARGFEGGLTTRRNWLKRHRNGRLKIYRAELDRIPIQRLLAPHWIVDAVDALLEFDILMRMIDGLAEAASNSSPGAESDASLDAQCHEIARQGDTVELQLELFRSFLHRSLTLSAGERLTVKHHLN